jgi:hypothetical protein
MNTRRFKGLVFQLALAAGLGFVSVGAMAASPAISNGELNGIFRGESVNGACTVKVSRLADTIVLDVDQNMTQHKSLPISSKALLQKISGDQCGGVKMNNKCGEYTVTDSVENGAGYNNSVSVSASIVKGQRCLEISISDASYSEWIGQNHCNINLNRSGKGCPAL